MKNDLSKQKKLSFIYKYSSLVYRLGVASMCVYLFLRIRKWANLVFHFETGYIICTLLLCFYIFTVFVMHCNLIPKTKLFTYIDGISTFIFIYTSMSIFAADIIQLLISLCLNDKSIINNIFFYSGYICFGVVLCSVIIGNYKTKKLVVVEDRFENSKFNKSCKIALLSDLHIGYFVGENHLKKVVKSVNNLDVDYVIIAGDIINSNSIKKCNNIDCIAALLSKLKSKNGTFAVVGNHDPDIDNEDLINFLNISKIKLLNDEVYSDDILQIIGRTTKTKPRKTITEFKNNISTNKPLLIIDHDPIGISEAIDQQADIVLCGHTHKGQIFPLNFFVRFLYNKNEFYGITTTNQTTSIVCSGTGYFNMPMRIGTNCEIVCITITPKMI